MAFREGEGVFYAISSNSSDGSRSAGDLIRVSVDDGSIVNTGVNILPGAYTADIDPATGYMHISQGGRNWTVFDLDTWSSSTPRPSPQATARAAPAWPTSPSSTVAATA